MNYLEIIQNIFTGLGSIGILVVVFAFWKMGFFDKKNGNGKNEIQELRKTVEDLKENDLTHIDLKLEKLIELGQESLFILRELKDKL